MAKIKELNNRAKKKSLRLKWIRYAAAVLIVIGLSGTMGIYISKNYLAFPADYTKVIVDKGERSTIVLPDGSTVKLNCGSQIKFLPNFNSFNKREVVLQGEGYFNVTHDKSNPFIVKTSDLEIEVLGTTFNVSSYSDDSVIETFLESGKVRINHIGDAESVTLLPFESLRFNKATGKYLKYSLSNQRLSDWTKGILTIKGETIEELAKKLERRFDVKIFFGDDKVQNHVYSGSIKDENLSIVLEALKFASSLNYDINGEIVTLSSKK